MRAKIGSLLIATAIAVFIAIQNAKKNDYFSKEAITIYSIMAAAWLVFGLYHLLRSLKGKLTLTTSVTSAKSNQPIVATLGVHAKKNINGLLIVGLVGQVRESVGSGKHRRTVWADVYRKEIVLEEERNFPIGFTQEYQFEFITPSYKDFFALGRVYWFIEARLDAKGIDLYAKQKLKIDLTDT